MAISHDNFPEYRSDFYNNHKSGIWLLLFTWSVILVIIAAIVVGAIFQNYLTWNWLAPTLVSMIGSGFSITIFGLGAMINNW